METPTSQLRINRNCIIAEGCGGSIIWVTPTRARQLIDAGAATLVNAPSEQPAIGPTETKPMEPAEKKYSATAQGGPSTALAKSNNAGKAKPSRSSAAARALQKNKSAKRAKQVVR